MTAEIETTAPTKNLGQLTLKAAPAARTATGYPVAPTALATRPCPAATFPIGGSSTAPLPVGRCAGLGKSELHRTRAHHDERRLTAIAAMPGDASAGYPEPRHIAAVTALRAELVDGGYTPVEVVNHDAMHTSPGKAPVRRDWQHGAPIVRTDPGALNTGILCDGLRAVDIDVDDQGIAAAVRARCVVMLGEAPMRYRANSARVLLLYRAAQGVPRKRQLVGTAGKVEVLGRGQQFVAFGRHPTGAELLWHPESPRSVPADHLPPVTEDQVSSLFAEIATMIGAGTTTAQDAEPERKASPLGQSGELLAVMSAVDAIPNSGPPNWDAWNRMGLAIWAATDASAAGREVWHAWSARHPTYDREDAEARWQHYATSPPKWIGAAALFAIAAEHGWRRHRDNAADKEEPSQRPDPTAEWWIERQIDRPEPLLGEVITNTTRVMVGGQTGIGKSHLAMGMAAALATGQPFAHWHTHRPVRVLYIDGEMSRDLVQERITDLKRRVGGADLRNLRVLCREDYPDFQPLNTEPGQAFVTTLVQRWKIEAVFFDNRMSLLSGDMKEELPWTETMPLVRHLTRERVAQIWIDHTGHDKTKIYGSSTKEWQLDAVALLTKVYRHGADVAFKIEFTKARRRRPETRADFETVTLSLCKGHWQVEGAADAAQTPKLSPMCRAFHDAFLEALYVTTTPGRTTRAAWFAECVRIGLADNPPVGAPYQEKDKRQKPFRKYVAELKAARLIGVDGETVIDLRKPTP